MAKRVASMSGELVICGRKVACKRARRGESFASSTARRTKFSGVWVIRSERPAAVRRLAPAREAGAGPLRVMTGTPIHRASQVVVMPL